MDKELKNQIAFALKVLVSDDRLRLPINTPYIQENKVVATNGVIILVLPASEELKESFKDNGARHPDYHKVLDEKIINIMEWKSLKMKDLDVTTETATLLGVPFFSKVLKEVMTFALASGIDSLAVAKYKEGQIIMKGLYNRKPLYILAMGIGISLYGEIKNTTFIPEQDIKSLSECAMSMDWSRGKIWYDKYLEKLQKEKEEHEKNNFRVYEVTLVRQVTVAVKADSRRDAEKIALSNVGFSDFMDNESEVDEVVESDKDNSQEDFDSYYDWDGEHDW